MAKLVREKTQDFLLKKLGAKVSQSRYVRCDWCGREKRMVYNSSMGAYFEPRGWRSRNGEVAYGNPLKRVRKNLDFCSTLCLKSYNHIANEAEKAALEAWKLTYRTARDKYLESRRKPAMVNIPIKTESSAPKEDVRDPDVDLEAIERFKRLEL